MSWWAAPICCGSGKIPLRPGDRWWICPASWPGPTPGPAISGGRTRDVALELGALTDDERKILLAGCLINYNKEKAGL